MIRVVAFDLDDTLYNATWLVSKSRLGGLKKMQEKGLNFIDFDKAIDVLNQVVVEFGSNYSKHFDIFLKKIKESNNIVSDISFNIPKFVACGVWGYHAAKVRYLKPYRDVKKFFEKIENYNMKIVLMSNGLAVKQYEKILRMKIGIFMDYIFISEEISFNKPDLEFFKIILEKINVEPNEVLYVGDRLDHDIFPANKIGIHSVLIHRGGKYDPNIKENRIKRTIKPEFEIHSLSELINIIKELNQVNTIN
jgi:putative hydrolase of the HAD superfamily